MTPTRLLCELARVLGDNPVKDTEALRELIERGWVTCLSLSKRCITERGAEVCGEILAAMEDQS